MTYCSLVGILNFSSLSHISCALEVRPRSKGLIRVCFNLFRQEYFIVGVLSEDLMGSFSVLCIKESKPLLRLGSPLQQKAPWKFLVQLLILWERELMARKIIDHLSCHILFSHLFHIFHVFSNLLQSLQTFYWNFRVE